MHMQSSSYLTKIYSTNIHNTRICTQHQDRYIGCIDNLTAWNVNCSIWILQPLLSLLLGPLFPVLYVLWRRIWVRRLVRFRDKKVHVGCNKTGFWFWHNGIIRFRGRSGSWAVQVRIRRVQRPCVAMLKSSKCLCYSYSAVQFSVLGLVLTRIATYVNPINP